MRKTHQSSIVLIVIAVHLRITNSFSISSSLRHHHHFERQHPVPLPNPFTSNQFVPLPLSLVSISLQATNSEDDDPTYYRSIGEVVGGLHGGKYQFGQVGNGNGYGALGSQFSGNGSRLPTNYNQDDNDEEEEAEEDLPAWAVRMGPPSITDTPIETIRVPSNSDPMDGIFHTATVSVGNDERTWEKYYAKILHGAMEVTETDDVPFRVVPRSGFLAPRGGASNACDASKPYSDTVTLRVSRRDDVAINKEDVWWLVVGTEEEKWCYRLEEDVYVSKV